MAAAELYEQLLAPTKTREPIDLVVCLDPWAACLLGHTQNPCPEATWVLVSDLADRKQGGDKEYWEDMEEWVRRLPSLLILDAQEMIPRRPADPTSPPLPYDSRDRAAMRSVFADSQEALILGIIADKDPSYGEACARMSKSLPEARWTLFGAASSSERIHPIGTECQSLLPAIASVADAVVLSPNANPPEGCAEDKIIRLTSLELDSPLEELSRMLSGRRSKTEEKSPEVGDYVLFNEWGIGDELLLSAAARELVKAFPSVRVWIRSRFGFAFPDTARGERRPPFQAKWVETIYQNPVLYGPTHHSPFPGHLVQQMLDKIALDTGLKVQAKDVRPELTCDVDTAHARNCRTVVVHAKPNPRLPSKDWGLDRWKKLCEILHDNGVRILQVGEEEDPRLPNAEDLRGTPVHELPKVIGEAAAVVCLVGFLMHLAEAVRTPAIVIYGGREHPAIDGYPNQIHLSSESLACRGRWGCHLAPDIECPHGMKCMETITPALVAKKTLQLLNGEGV
jgi:hypothetical protein